MSKSNGKCSGLSRLNREWHESDARLIHNHYSISHAKWAEFWDRRAAVYEQPEGRQDRAGAEVTGYLVREGLLSPGDRVLDVGCGPGAYTVDFARTAGEVHGLDVSGEMLNRLASNAENVGVDNVRTIQSVWESFEAAEPYDLVFSSFCPAICGLEMLLKMERHSRRSCCYVTGGTINQPEGIRLLHEKLTGASFDASWTGDFFSVNVLFASGRYPEVRPFRVPLNPWSDPALTEKNYFDYFSMFLKLDESRAATIRQFTDDFHQAGGPSGGYRTFYAVTWPARGAIQKDDERLAHFLLRENLVNAGGRVLDASGKSALAGTDGLTVTEDAIASAAPGNFDLAIVPPFTGGRGLARIERQEAKHYCVLCTPKKAGSLFNFLYDNDRVAGIKHLGKRASVVYWCQPDDW